MTDITDTDAISTACFELGGKSSQDLRKSSGSLAMFAAIRRTDSMQVRSLMFGDAKPRVFK